VIEYLRGSAQARYYDEGKIELNGLVSYVAKNTNDYVIQKRLTSDGQLPVLRGNTSNWILGDPPTNPPSIPLPIHNATGETISNSIGMQLTLVRKGTFLMGAPPHERFVGRRFLGVRPDEEDSNDDERQHIVTISKDFYLGIYEVTQAEYQTIMGKNPSRFQGDVIAERDPNTGQVVRRVSSSLYPVEQVSWNDAVEFCKKLSELPNERAAGLVYRLPTEAEWEYACRAESKTSFCFGDNYDNRLSEYAWFSSPKTHKYTRPVATKKPNPWGLYDMHGNVWEWCSDWYGDYPTSAVVDPVGPATGLTRVCRGGSFVNPQEECRSACRGGEGSLPHDTPFDLGFRVALSSTGIPQSPEADK
jgi:formylglycine-generating enzyme required for sulfatase activity